MNKKCNKIGCENEINLDKDETVCGYGSCVKCCRVRSGHRTHINTKKK